MLEFLSQLILAGALGPLKAISCKGEINPDLAQKYNFHALSELYRCGRVWEVIHLDVVIRKE